MAKKTILKIASFTAAFLTICLLCFLFLELSNRGKIARGLEVEKIKLGGIKISRAPEILQEKINQFNDKKIYLVYGQNKINSTPQELGIKINTEKTLANAYAFGHKSEKIFLSAIEEQISAFLFGKTEPLIYSINSEKMDNALSEFNGIENKPQNATLKFNPNTNNFEISAPKNGILVNKQKLAEDIIIDFNNLQPAEIYLSLEPAEPLLKERDLALLKPEAENITGRSPHYLRNGDIAWKIDEQEIADWILILPPAQKQEKAQLSLDQEKIKTFLLPIAASLNQEATDARLGWENGNLKFLIPAQNGQEVNIEKNIENIENKIINGEPELNLIIDLIKPEIDSANIQELGISSLIGKGESNFSGSPKNRKYNLSLGASKLNGLLIKPGEEFSFAQEIGSIDGKNGWLPELVIKNGQTIPEFGGGICQVSTTLFRAAVKSGLKITERYPHAYPVKYYNPPGFDSTVYPPKPDLKFINNTPAHILLQSKISDNKLVFEIYGTNDGREIKIKGPTILNSNPDGSMKTILTQEIWREGELKEQNIFRSSYKSPSLYPIATLTPEQTSAPAQTLNPNI